MTPYLAPNATQPLWSAFTVVDWLIVVVLLWSTISALRRGAIRELFSLVGLVAGLLLASWNYQSVAPYLRQWITSPPTADAAAFLGVLGTVSLLCAVVGRLLRSGAHAAGLGLFDRLGGAAIGFVRGTLACVALLMACTAFLPAQTALQNSRLTPYLLAAAHGVSFVVPPELKRQLTLGTTTLMHTRSRWSKLMPESDNAGQTSDQDPK